MRPSGCLRLEAANGRTNGVLGFWKRLRVLKRSPDTARLPDFLVIGAMKSGTTTLHYDLASVPEIFMPLTKEPACLVDDSVLTPEGMMLYARHYRRASVRQRCGDASTAYAKLPQFTRVPERALQVLGPTTKIIYVVRDPVHRLVSHHRHEYSKGAMPYNIEEALSRFPELVAYSSYKMQLVPWLTLFGRSNIKVISFESYIRSRKDTIAELAQHLNVPGNLDLIDFSRSHNVGPRVPVNRFAQTFISSSLYREWMRRFISPSVRDALRKKLASSPSLPEPPPLAEDRMMQLATLFKADMAWLGSQFDLDLRWVSTLDSDVQGP